MQGKNQNLGKSEGKKCSNELHKCACKKSRKELGNYPRK